MGSLPMRPTGGPPLVLRCTFWYSRYGQAARATFRFHMSPNIEFVDGVERVDFGTVHEWLTNSYWSPGITREKVEKAAHHSSLVVGAYDGDKQIGYLRVVSDLTRFAWICDVYVALEYRGQGIAKAMVRHAVDHPEHSDLRRWLLATRDAHPIYAECGFVQLPEPKRWMILLKDP